MNNAEVMVVVLVAAAFFGSNFRMAANFLKEHGYIHKMLSESRLNRGYMPLMMMYGDSFQNYCRNIQSRNQGQEYITDSFPVPVCDNIRIAGLKFFRERISVDIFRVNADIFMVSGFI